MSIGPRKPPKRAAPPHVPEIIERAAPPPPRYEIFNVTLTRIEAPWWVYDSRRGGYTIRHMDAFDGHSARYETRAEAEALVMWLTERAAGYPRNPAMDVWPPDPRMGTA